MAMFKDYPSDTGHMVNLTSNICKCFPLPKDNPIFEQSHSTPHRTTSARTFGTRILHAAAGCSLRAWILWVLTWFWDGFSDGHHGCLRWFLHCF